MSQADGTRVPSVLVETSDPSFRLGDVVRHKSGGPQLAVTGVYLATGNIVVVECSYLLGPGRGRYASIFFFRESLRVLWRRPLPEA